MGSQHKAVFSLSFSFFKAEEGVSVLMKCSGGLEDQEMALGHGGKEHPTPRGSTLAVVPCIPSHQNHSEQGHHHSPR